MENTQWFVVGNKVFFFHAEASAALFHSDGPYSICNLSKESEPWLTDPDHPPVKQIVQQWKFTAVVQKTFTDVRYRSAYQENWKKTDILDKKKTPVFSNEIWNWLI